MKLPTPCMRPVRPLLLAGILLSSTGCLFPLEFGLDPGRWDCNFGDQTAINCPSLAETASCEDSVLGAPGPGPNEFACRGTDCTGHCQRRFPPARNCARVLLSDSLLSAEQCGQLAAGATCARSQIVTSEGAAVCHGYLCLDTDCTGF